MSENNVESELVKKRHKLLEQIARCSNEIKRLDADLIDLRADKADHRYDGTDIDCVELAGDV